MQDCLLVPHSFGGGGGGSGSPADETDWLYIGDPGQPAFNTGYANLGVVDTSRGGYKRQNGQVHLSGTITVAIASIGSNPVFTLPVGFRPDFQQAIHVYLAGDPGAVKDGWVTPAGEVFVITNETDFTFYWLPGASVFWIEGPETFD